MNMRLLSMTLIAGLLVLNLPLTYAESKDYVNFVSNIERIKAHMTLLEQYMQSDASKAFTHASDIGRLASQIDDEMREKDRVLADKVYLNLIDLPAMVKASDLNVKEHLTEGRLLLDKAIISIVPSELRDDHRFNAQITFMLITAADKEYEDGDNEIALYYMQRAKAIYDEQISKDISGQLAQDLQSKFADLQQAMSNGESITSVMSILQRELLSISNQRIDHAKYFSAIRSLYSELIDKYKAKNYVDADELAIKAYLDNFEYIEPELTKIDKVLMLELEESMRVKLRDMIKRHEPPESVEAHVNETLLKLAEAERMLNEKFSTLDVDLITSNGNTLIEEKPIGSAEENAKKDVMAQVDAIKLKLMQLLEDYSAGDYDSAYDKARSAYLDNYEFIEIPLSPIDPNFTLETEIRFSELRQLIQQRATYEAVQAKVVEIRRSLSESERLVTGTGIIAPTIAFSSSFAIIFREGLESALIVGAIITYLEASRNERYKKHVYYGVVIGLAATVLTWFVASFIITISGIDREVMEAVAALSATAVLFYVSFWVLNRIETKKWMEFVKAKVWQATATGSMMVFILLSFFTVYREGFETVLFYQAMFSFAKHMEHMVALGFILGLGSLVLVYYGMRRMGKRLPLRTLFALTMGIGAYLSIAFVGNGIRELQEGGYMQITPLFNIIPRFDINVAIMTGIHPTLETIVAQIILLSIYVTGILYVLILKPRRERVIALARRSRTEIESVENE